METKRLNLRKLQKEQDKWQTRNFPGTLPVFCILGAVEEVGELCHAILKKQQGIRGSKKYHEAKIDDAIADIVIFLVGFCNLTGRDFEQILAKVWTKVKKRNWKKNKLNGHKSS